MNFLSPNGLLSPDQVSGQTINLWRTDPRHVAGQGDQTGSGAGSQNFGQMLLDGLNEVNTLQQEHSKLAVQAVLDPKSVNVHDVTIAEAKANMALSIAKNVVDRVIQAYQTIINIH
ncbi:MAG TPA: flagellar hook-basal body complex protein FliE [Spirochaetia bacterium]|nr:flagellar hook-basal body complex protein FliE [Spirochaetia bacterium]